MCRWFESNRGSQEELSFSVPLFSWLEKTAKSQQLPLPDPKGGTWQQSGGLLQPPWLCRSKASPTGGAKKENWEVRCIQLRKHSKAREKRYSFGYAVLLSCCFLSGSSIVEGKVFRLMPGLGIFEHHTVRIKGIAGHHSQAVITVHKNQFPVLGCGLFYRNFSLTGDNLHL